METKADSISEIQVVVFNLGEEEYGINISKVQEIIRMPDITKLPNIHEYILGVANLRGNVIPILDLKKRFMGYYSEYAEESRVIVVEIPTGKLGLVVDGVAEVIKLTGETIIDADSIGVGSSIDQDYLLGVAKYNDRLFILLAVDDIIPEKVF